MVIEYSISYEDVEQAASSKQRKESMNFFIPGWLTGRQDTLLVGKQYGTFKPPDFILSSILGEYFWALGNDVGPVNFKWMGLPGVSYEGSVWSLIIMVGNEKIKVCYCWLY